MGLSCCNPLNTINLNLFHQKESRHTYCYSLACILCTVRILYHILHTDQKQNNIFQLPLHKTDKNKVKAMHRRFKKYVKIILCVCLLYIFHFLSAMIHDLVYLPKPDKICTCEALTHKQEVIKDCMSQLSKPRFRKTHCTRVEKTPSYTQGHSIYL